MIGAGNDGRPLFPTFGRTTTTNLWNGFTNSDYHSLQIALNRRMVNGLFIKAAYTWSHAINMTDDDGWASLSFDAFDFQGRNRATAGFNRTQVLRFATVYELPFGGGKKLASSGNAAWKILGGWQVNSIFSSFQGTHFSIGASGSSLNLPSNRQFADQVGPIETLGGVGDDGPFINTNSFVPVTDVRFGTSGRNIMRGPGVVKLDLSHGDSAFVRGWIPD